MTAVTAVPCEEGPPLRDCCLEERRRASPSTARQCAKLASAPSSMGRAAGNACASTHMITHTHSQHAMVSTQHMLRPDTLGTAQTHRSHCSLQRPHTRNLPEQERTGSLPTGTGKGPPHHSRAP